MRILVTGGAGFIGWHLCGALLEYGHDVLCMDNLFTGTRENMHTHRRYEFLRHDVCEPFHIECDRIYHLACPASPLHYQKNPVRTIRTAIEGTLNALQCARDTGARMLLASTSEVYGDPLSHPQKETDCGNVNPIGARSCYDEGKRAGEALSVAWSAQYNTDVRIARIFNTFGPRMAQGDGRLIPNFIMQAQQNGAITVYGDGKQTRSFCYVDDLVSGMMGLMEVKSLYKPLPINLGNPDERTVLSVAEAIRDRLGGAIEHKPLPEDDPRRRCPDIDRAHKILGWQPRVSFADGLEKTIAFYQEKH